MQTAEYFENATRREIILPAVPDLMKTQQDDAALLISKRRFCLFNEPGTGKTLTALQAWLHLGMAPPHKLVVICPPVAVVNWVEWTLAIWHQYNKRPLNLQVVRSSKTRVKNEADVIVTTYPLFSTSRNNLMRNIIVYNPDVVVLDESHYLASADAVRTKTIYGLGSYEGIVSKAECVWLLTGTPIRRYNDDLWPALHAVFPEIAKEHGVAKKYQYLSTFCETQKFRYGGRIVDKVVGSKNHVKLNRILFSGENFIARQRNLDPETMPPVTFRNVSVDYNPSPELAALTKQASKVRYNTEDGIAEMNPAISACWSTLAQAKAGSVHSYLSGLLEDGVTGILALFWHREMASMMSSLTNAPHGVIHGGVNSATRQTMISKFNCGEYPILYGQIGAMGVAINLQQGGKYVVFCERSWSPGDNVQAYRRVWRMGQSKHVQVDVCLTNHLIDDMQSRILTKKEAFTHEVMGK